MEVPQVPLLGALEILEITDGEVAMDQWNRQLKTHGFLVDLIQLIPRKYDSFQICNCLR